MRMSSDCHSGVWAVDELGVDSVEFCWDIAAKGKRMGARSAAARIVGR
jgi:hypothetical protein